MPIVWNRSYLPVILLSLLLGWAPQPRAELVAKDMAITAGVTCPGSTACLTQGETPAFDHDGDGKVDLLLSVHGSLPWPLLRNDGSNRFQTVFNALKTDRHGCVAADFGSEAGPPDGRPDLYCVTGACEGRCTKAYPNHLYVQTPTNGFVEVGASRGVADVHGRGRVPLALDFDRDGDQDIAVLNDAPSVVGSPNRLFRNDGGMFEEVVGGPFNTETRSKCGKAGDLDGDGWVDLVICSTAVKGIRLMTYKNNRGTFEDVTASTGYKRLSVKEVEIADIDADGDQDLLILEGKRFSVWRNDGQGRHPAISYSRRIDLGRDLAVGDVKKDGKPDVYIVQGNNPAYSDIMLINNGTGVGFATLPLPNVTVGDGDVATAIPNWNGSGRAAFLVSNGKWGTPGPYQLIVFTYR